MFIYLTSSLMIIDPALDNFSGKMTFLGVKFCVFFEKQQTSNFQSILGLINLSNAFFFLRLTERKLQG